MLVGHRCSSTKPVAAVEIPYSFGRMEEEGYKLNKTDDGSGSAAAVRAHAR